MPIKPMLCKSIESIDDVPADTIWERKYDGIRCIATVNRGVSVSLQSRSGKDKTKMFPELKFKSRADLVLDGEIVSGDNFNNIQHRSSRENGISQAADKYPATFVVFDVLAVNGPSSADLRRLPLVKRKEFLNQALVPTENVIISDFYDDGNVLLIDAKENQWEGIIGKRPNSLYSEGSRTEWFKLKLWKTEPFVIVGYTDGTGWREGIFGALVLADMQGNYVGSVGTGFDEKQLRLIEAKIKASPQGSCPFPKEPLRATWITNKIACKIRYLEYTNDGMLRFPSYKGEL